MKCNKVKLYMISDIYNELSYIKAYRLNRHIKHCLNCSKEYEELRSFQSLSAEKLISIVPDEKIINFIKNEAYKQFKTSKAVSAPVLRLFPVRLLRFAAPIVLIGIFIISIGVFLRKDNNKIEKRDVMRVSGKIGIDKEIKNINKTLNLIYCRNAIEGVSRHDKEVILLNYYINKLMSEKNKL